MIRKYAFVLLLLILMFAAPASSLLAQTTDLSDSFTYQGYLTDATGTVNQFCDFQFGLFTALTGGVQFGSTQTKTNVVVNNGVFTVVLDFGTAVFNGTDRYLDIQVRCPTGSGTYTTLTPRQAITPTPYALGLYGLQVQQNATSPNLIGGFSGNNVTPGVVGAVISGAGVGSSINQVTDSYGVIGGGTGNRAGDNAGTVSDAQRATVGGGFNNTASATTSTVGGGLSNVASGARATISGGAGNIASGQEATVAGGDSNLATNLGAFVGGGEQNAANQQYTTIAGGYTNTASDEYATIGGGFTNTASGGAATVGGGYENSGGGIESTVGGGYSNSANATVATVSGGYDNTASGFGATVPGGQLNIADGDYSFAAGRRANAAHNGAFVWADNTDADFSSNLDNQFFARATGGFAFYTNAELTNGCTLSTGGGTWNCTSDRNTKEDFAAVDTQAVLSEVLNIPITTWVYKGTEARHIGPMAQDFYAAFGVGEDDRHISMVDSDGVALAAIQGLYQVIQDKDAQITNLQTENETLKIRLDDLDQRLAALEAIASPSQAGIGSPLMLIVLAAGVLGLWGWRATHKKHSYE
jgi:hypothetical protein